MRNRFQTSRALTAAREAAAEQFLAIADAIKAEAGIRVHSVCDTLSSRCWAGMRVIEAPEGRTRRQVYILARACARVVLHSARKDRGVPKDALDLKSRVGRKMRCNVMGLASRLMEVERSSGFRGEADGAADMLGTPVQTGQAGSAHTM